MGTPNDYPATTPAAPAAAAPFTQAEIQGLAYLLRRAIATGQLGISCQDLDAAGRERDRGTCLASPDWVVKPGRLQLDDQPEPVWAVRLWLAPDDLDELYESVPEL